MFCLNRVLLKAAIRKILEVKIYPKYIFEYITSQCSKLSPYFSPAVLNSLVLMADCDPERIMCL